MINIYLGILKVNQVISGSSLGNGTNYVQNRNQTKQNFANYSIGDGIIFQPAYSHINFDADVADNISQDGPNVVFGPML